MVGSHRVWLFALGLLLLPLHSAQAQFWGCYCSPALAFYAPECCYPMCPLPVSTIVADVKPTPPAPAPEPTKETKEPPVAHPKPRGPILHEMKSYTGTAPPSRVRVGFWNFTDKEVTLTIEDMNITRKIPPQLSVQLDVFREFTWRIDDLPPRMDRIADNKNEDERVVR